jgi:hypothetical protein
MPKGVGAAGNIPEGTTELTNTVRLQDTGNAPAIHVSIIDTMVCRHNSRFFTNLGQ